jgi:cation diffusion facilitator family transporter
MADDERGSGEAQSSGGESLVTVIVALTANTLIAIAKSVVAFITGSASMVAEAAHSWADAGNEVFLLTAERRAKKPRDAQHPFGYGREAYVWSMFAAFGLFGAGSVVSVWHGVQSLTSPEQEADYLWAYVVLGIAFVLEGISFVQASRQTHAEARQRGLHALMYLGYTSNPTLRAVFAEDAAALIGIVLAGSGIALHQITGNAVWDAVGSILVGLLLGAVAIYLIDRNRDFLVGETVRPELFRRIHQALDESPEVERLTFLHLEFVGPNRILLLAAVDLVGDEDETHVAQTLTTIGRRLEDDEFIERAMITLSRPDAPTLDPDGAPTRR